MAGLVFSVAFVCIAQTAATVRRPGAGALADSTINRDLIGSVVAGLIGAFPVDASPPNTAIAAASGTRSQLANTIAAVVVLAVLLAATGPLADLPQAMLAAMLERATLYLPAVASLNVLRVWTGFRAATPDKLPLIGPFPGDSTLWLATGHEGLGITTALATAELLAAAFTEGRTAIPHEPYLPARFAPAQQSEDIL